MSEELIARLRAGERSNYLDVLIEVAVFKPDERDVSIRANAAGTKVIYTDDCGQALTCWAPDWSERPELAIKKLEALSHDQH